MPKMKTVSSAKKRFRVTATGQVRYEKAFRNHILTSKNRKRKRNLRQDSLVHSSDLPRIKHLLCMA